MFEAEMTPKVKKNNEITEGETCVKLFFDLLVQSK